jgi:hypothetical protein
MKQHIILLTMIGLVACSKSVDTSTHFSENGNTSSVVRVAGTSSGGGGGVYMCGHQAIMIDLWESTKLPFRWPSGLGVVTPIYDDQTSFENQILEALEKLARSDQILADKVAKDLDWIRSNVEYLTDDTSVTLPTDLDIALYPTGCPPVGMMFFSGEDQKLYVKEEIFSKLKSQTDIAAAYMHEAIYKALREWEIPKTYGHRPFEPHVSSRLARKLNACLFSKENCLNFRAENEGRVVKQKLKFVCENSSSRIYYYYDVIGGRQTGPSLMWVYKLNGTEYIGGLVKEEDRQSGFYSYLGGAMVAFRYVAGNIDFLPIFDSSGVTLKKLSVTGLSNWMDGNTHLPLDEDLDCKPSSN